MDRQEVRALSQDPSAMVLMQSLGADLRRFRKERTQYSQVQVAQALGCTQAWISNIEAGKKSPTDEQLRAMCALYGVDQRTRGRLEGQLDAMRTLRQKWWLSPEYRNFFDADDQRYFALEDAAQRIQTHSGTYVPGLLQTEEYIRSIAEFGRTHESAARRNLFVEIRLRRQAELLNKPNPPRLEVVMLQAALVARVGGVRVMRKQLTHLREAVEEPNVTLRVVPLSVGAASAMGMPISILEYPASESPPVVVTEGDIGSRLSRDAGLISWSRRRLQALRGEALSAADSSKLIERVKEEL
ncbi:helix-turn-helix domain-containing protein [Kitasatospora acidiphila]|uniref:Helix-turn-helix domain-containing protein n=1 Tax=Kitasatospora acidiphila TaxID=2567942 RepID=A0A540W9Z5_9ACTN|nr:helix-turn-helix transcriptional regulator [Kitasatospora acidiphila]TQF05818.1 helix-turn-helix domain-containing protein [Kitasatospora acidiphila]